MFNPFLTIDAVGEALGEIEDSAEVVFDSPTDAVPLIKKTASTLVHSAFREGLAKSDGDVLTAPDTILVAISDLAHSARVLIQKALVENSQSHEKSDAYITDGWYGDRWYEEALTNALEHGTEFCQKGVVTLRVVEAKQGMACFIDQSCNYQEFLSKIRPFITASTFPVNTNYVTPVGVKRGYGFRSLLNDKFIQFSYELLPPDGLRIIILKTTQ